VDVVKATIQARIVVMNEKKLLFMVYFVSAELELGTEGRLRRLWAV